MKFVGPTGWESKLSLEHDEIIHLACKLGNLKDHCLPGLKVDRRHPFQQGSQY